MTPRWSRVSATDSWLKSTKDAGKPPTASAAEQNLAVRETPGKGFYVEGVQVSQDDMHALLFALALIVY